MLSFNDFLEKFETYSDEELCLITLRPDDYSDEAQQAANAIIEKRGGKEVLLLRVQQNALLEKERNRIKAETHHFAMKGSNAGLIKTLIKSNILPEEEVDAIITNKFESANREIADKTIDTKTIFNCVIGGTVASMVTGAAWGLYLSQVDRIFWFVFVCLGVMCYLIVNLFTRKSKQNTAVLITTIIATLLSYIIGSYTAFLFV